MKEKLLKEIKNMIAESWNKIDGEDEINFEQKSFDLGVFQTLERLESLIKSAKTS